MIQLLILILFFLTVYKSPVWKLEYRFKELYGAALCKDSAINVVNQIVSAENSTWTHYSSHMKTSFGGISSTSRFLEHCAAKYAQLDNYKKCIAYFKSRGA